MTDAFLIREYDAGASIAQFAAKTNRSVYAVEFRLLKLGKAVTITPYLDN